MRRVTVALLLACLVLSGCAQEEQRTIVKRDAAKNDTIQFSSDAIPTAERVFLLADSGDFEQQVHRGEELVILFPGLDRNPWLPSHKDRLEVDLARPRPQFDIDVTISLRDHPSVRLSAS